MLKQSENQKERREKFRKLGAAISKIKFGDPDVPDYHSGRESKFHMVHGDSHDRELHELPLGPEFRTPQWVRTVNQEVNS